MHCSRNELWHLGSYSQYQFWSWETNLEVNLTEVFLGFSSELLLCWFFQHLHWSRCHKRRLQEVCRRCNWSEHTRTCSLSINLDLGIWTSTLDSWTRSSFQNCIFLKLYYIIINLILFYCYVILFLF